MVYKQNVRCRLHRMIQSIFLIMCFVVLSAVIFYSKHTVTSKAQRIYSKLQEEKILQEDKRQMTDILQGDKKPASEVIQEDRKLVAEIGQEDKKETTDNVVKRHWRRVGSEEAYVFSAYYKPFEHIVEMVGIVKKTKLSSKLYCLFPDKDGNNASYRYSASLEHVDGDHGYIRYQTVFIRCTIPMHTTPSKVTLQIYRNSTTIPIIYSETRNIYNLSVCYPSFFNNYSYHEKLISAIESNILFGVQFFTVYKHSVTDEVDKVFDYYVKRGLMEVINWNKPKTNIHHDGQWSHIQDCHFWHRYKSTYVMVLDVDELIVPYKHRNLVDLIRDLEKNKKFSPGSYMFRHALFDVDFDEDTSSYPLQQEVEQLQITCLKHVWRSVTLQPPTWRTKTIHIPPRVITAGIHYTMKLVSGFREHSVNPNLAYVHHYRGNTRIGNKTKDDFIRNYTSELVLNVKQVHQILRFLK